MKDRFLKFQVNVYLFINRYRVLKLIWDNQVQAGKSLTETIAKLMM